MKSGIRKQKNPLIELKGFFILYHFDFLTNPNFGFKYVQGLSQMLI